MGKRKNNRLMKEMLNYYEGLSFIREDGSFNTTTICIYFTEILKQYGLIGNGKMQRCGNITIYPKEYFCPFNDQTGVLNKTENTYAIHWYSKTWMEPKQKIRNKITRVLHRFLERSALGDSENEKHIDFITRDGIGRSRKKSFGTLKCNRFKKYQVDLFLMRHEGSLLEDIPENINLLPEIPAYTVLARPLKDVIKERHFILAFGRIVGKIKARSYEKKRNIIDSGVGLEYSHKYTVPYMPKIQKQKVYDMAISFLTPHYFVEQKVRAKKKIAWIHTDYSKVQINVESELKMWKKYDKIVSISDAVTESFLKVFPDLKDKIVVIENILPEQLIYKQMDEFDVSEEMFSEGVKLLSIGRYCYAKTLITFLISVREC